MQAVQNAFDRPALINSEQSACLWFPLFDFSARALVWRVDL